MKGTKGTCPEIPNQAEPTHNVPVTSTDTLDTQYTSTTSLKSHRNILQHVHTGQRSMNTLHEYSINGVTMFTHELVNSEYYY